MVRKRDSNPRPHHYEEAVRETLPSPVRVRSRPLRRLARHANWNYLSRRLAVQRGGKHRRNAISRSDQSVVQMNIARSNGATGMSQKTGNRKL